MIEKLILKEMEKMLPPTFLEVSEKYLMCIWEAYWMFWNFE